MRTQFLIRVWPFLLAFYCQGAETTPLPVASNAGSGRPTIDLSGEWEFKLDPMDAGRTETWFAMSNPYPRRIRVPGAWNAQGVAYESEEQLRAYEARCLEEQKPLNQLGTLGVQRESERLFSAYPGPGWYQTQVRIPAEWKGKQPWLVFDGVHREAEVWINGKPAASHFSYLIPFRINLSPYAQPGDSLRITVRVDARRRKEIDPLMGCLDTLDFLYVTWGGIHRGVRLEAIADSRLEDVFVVPQLASDTADMRVALSNARALPLTLSAEILDANGVSVAAARKMLEPGTLQTSLLVRIPGAKRWSPKSPYLYTARVSVQGEGEAVDTRLVRFGMREFKVARENFLLNGAPIFLRGYGDDSIFPNTICPPDSKEEFRRRLSVARDYGFNYVRHHSWTPPKEYLEAADELGMMLQPEFPFAYRWDLPTTPDAKRAALEQWEAILRLNRNHPSIVCWCMGNELYDSFDLAAEMYRIAKSLDPTRPVIDSDGCSFKHQNRETLDFLVVQFGEGSSIGHQDSKYAIPATITKPVIAHEMGYFVTLPDLTQTDLFRSGLRPYWLYQTRDLATRNGIAPTYGEWLSASYRLQAASLKSNLEAARRSRLRGTSVWLFQDYPNCAEGVVDMFLRPKGVLPEQFKKYNSPTVLLLDTPRRNWQAGEAGVFKFLVSRFEDEPSDAATLQWKLSGDAGSLAEGTQDRLQVRSDGVQDLLSVTLEMPRSSEARRLTLAAKLIDANGKTENSWDLWVFPKKLLSQDSHNLGYQGFDAIRTLYPWATPVNSSSVPSNTELLLTTHLGQSEKEYLQVGGRVFLLEPEPAFVVEKTHFRLSSWDGGGPSGTLIDTHHPALRQMPSEGWCDLQFYPLIQESKSILLSALPVKIHPLVRCIDRPTRLADRAYLFEVAVGQGKLLVSGFDFKRSLSSNDAGALFLLDQLVRYALGAAFAPGISLPIEALETAITSAKTTK